jgi:hypothetical protein
VYSVKPKPEIIMNDIYKNGPVVAAMKVYEDFVYYKGGKFLISSSTHSYLLTIIGFTTYQLPLPVPIAYTHDNYVYIILGL